MAKVKINLDEISDGFTLLEPGNYGATLFDCEEEMSSKGNPMLIWTWQVGDNEIKSYTSLQEHALFGLKEHLEAFGLSGEVDFDTDRLIGKKVQLSIGITKVKSRTTGEDIEVNRINKVSPLSKREASDKSGKASRNAGMPF